MNLKKILIIGTLLLSSFNITAQEQAQKNKNRYSI